MAKPAPAVPTRAELRVAGKALRSKVPRRAHAVWRPARNRPDPVAQVIKSSEGRMPELIPIRYGRMLQSPFTFFRGAAALMAADLARTPKSGIVVQACGDCHCLNFGGFATPERNVIFDINDFDETHPAPWEWDLKRLATSFVLAGRTNGHGERSARAAGEEAARAYRLHMAEYAAMPVLRQWYAALDWETLMTTSADPRALKVRLKRLAKAKKGMDSTTEYPKLARRVGRRHVIIDNPPLIDHPTLGQGRSFKTSVAKTLDRYRSSLPPERRVLFDRFRLADIARKVAGIGSVGTLCAVGLFLGEDDEPLFLQIKEARASVLEPYTAKSAFANHGERVVAGQRLMQAASDTFLGWTHGDAGRHFYIRQLRDVKLKPLVELFEAAHLREFAGFCGWALARSHARSGKASLISGYIGSGPSFDEAIAGFARHYADQTERDHAALVQAAREGRVEVVLDL